MYDELVNALRGCVLSKPCDGCPYYDPNGPTEIGEQCLYSWDEIEDAIDATETIIQAEEG